MTRLFRPLLAILVLGAGLLPQTVWARQKNNHSVQHHKVRRTKHHHHHPTGA